MEITVMLVMTVMLLAFGAFHLKAQSNLFGVFLGLLMIVFGLFIFFDGIEYRTGLVAMPQGEFEVNESLNVTYTFANLEDTNSNLHTVITWTLLLAGIYVMFNSGFNLTGVRQKA